MNKIKMKIFKTGEIVEVPEMEAVRLIIQEKGELVYGK